MARQFLVVERLGVPFGLTQDGGAAVCVQARDIKLMVGMPPGADPADALLVGKASRGSLANLTRSTT